MKSILYSNNFELLREVYKSIDNLKEDHINIKFEKHSKRDILQKYPGLKSQLDNNIINKHFIYSIISDYSKTTDPYNIVKQICSKLNIELI